jgi:phage tail-like protein
MNESVPYMDTSELLSLAVDYYNRYPGEQVTFYLRFSVPEQPKTVLQFTMPSVMQVESYQLPTGTPPDLPSMVEVNQEHIILIPLDEHFVVGQLYEIQIKVRIHTFSINQFLITDSSLVTDDQQILAAETLQIAVFGKGKYLRFLPEIYDNDDFTSRFLMLFESFWKPISQQIDQGEYYFDPDLTPPAFVPWLASWLGLPVDPSLPLNRVRTLLKSAMILYQYRGTHQALQTFLEIYTDGEVDIVEQRAKNFILGGDSSLGVDIALGSENQPNSLIINLRMPETELQIMGYSENMYHRKMNEIIRTMVPAHTVIDVKCAFYTQEKLRSLQ